MPKNNSPKYPAYIIKVNVLYKLLYCLHVIVEKPGNLPLFYCAYIFKSSSRWKPPPGTGRCCLEMQKLN